MWTSTPITPLTTTTAASATRRAAIASATKLGSPGVSIRLISRPACSKQASEALIESERSCSSGSWSETVVPSSTVPSRLTAPASNSIASCRLVLPQPRCPTRATLRIRSAALCGTYRKVPAAAQNSTGISTGQAAVCRPDFKRITALVCSCETRDSVTPRTSPISRRVRFS